MRAWPAIIPSSSLRPETAKSNATRTRCAGVPPEPSMRSMAAMSRALKGSYSYFVAFIAMSSPNHRACSWASE
jgi:hypothetical protein